MDAASLIADDLLVFGDGCCCKGRSPSSCSDAWEIRTDDGDGGDEEVVADVDDGGGDADGCAAGLGTNLVYRRLAAVGAANGAGDAEGGGDPRDDVAAIDESVRRGSDMILLLKATAGTQSDKTV